MTRRWVLGRAGDRWVLGHWVLGRAGDARVLTGSWAQLAEGHAVEVVQLDVAPAPEAQGLDGRLPAAHHRGVAVLAATVGQVPVPLQTLCVTGDAFKLVRSGNLNSSPSRNLIRSCLI